MALQTLDLYKGIGGLIRIQLEYEDSTLDVKAIIFQNLSKFFVQFQILNTSSRISHTVRNINPSTSAGTRLGIAGLKLEAIADSGFKVQGTFSYSVRRKRTAF